MANIAIIPARGGSKRLPGKNIKPLGGKPLIGWTIEAAIESGCFDRIIVSTDDHAIAKTSIEFGAEVPFMRPAEISGDMSSSDDAIQHSVRWLEECDRLDLETITILQPTSPFRRGHHIKECFALFDEKHADAIVAVTPIDTRLELCGLLPDDYSLKEFIASNFKRTQDMQQYYQLNGAIYLFKRRFVGVLSQLYEANIRSYAYVMPQEYSVDIDTSLDFDWADFLLKTQKVNVKKPY